MSKQNSVSKVPDVVNWEDPALKRWLNSITRSTTRANYKTAFRAYTAFTGLTATALIDEAAEDAKRDLRQKQDVVLTRLLGFYNWLKTEYPKKTRGKGVHEISGKGVADKSAHMWVNAIRSFYATFGVTVRMKGRRRLPKAKVKNKRMIVSAEQVKVLVDHARTPRDRAIILTHFQAGLDVSTLCSLKYGDVAEGLEKNEHPLKLELYRPKTGVDFYTFLGRDAVEALKAYLADRRARGVEFNSNMALFLQERGKKRLKTKNVQDMTREVALKAGLIDEKNNGRDFNPLGPHALRESFGSIMTNSGVPDTVVDFWHGHEVGEMARAYRSVQFDSLKQMYLEREHLLSISTGHFSEKEFDVKVSTKVDERVEVLQRTLTNLATENTDLKHRIQLTEGKLSEIGKTVAELKKTFEELIKGE